jgi:hypothetical protein
MSAPESTSPSSKSSTLSSTLPLIDFHLWPLAVRMAARGVTAASNP